MPNAAAEQQDLQTAIEQAGNDRASMLRNLLEYLKKYPQSSQRPQIYRAIVESSLQLRDFATDQVAGIGENFDPAIWGALNRAAREMTGDEHQRVRLADHAARALRSRTPSLSRLNDRGTHADVLALMDGYLEARAT